MQTPTSQEFPSHVQVYLVGGAVRDFLLGVIEGKFKTIEERKKYWEQVEKDWVVVGSTPEEMIKLGFRPVGKSFPVFLHPKTQEEYALARTERKVGKGYTGFEFYAEKDVTLEEDLKRRDLTINAIAVQPDLERISPKTIIDPYHGYTDLKKGIFRHVSEAFAEDPVRILRIARLATRFDHFEVDDDTNTLMKKMVLEGEVDALTAERVWQEWERSLKENSPWRFFEILEDCQAKSILFPEITRLEDKKEKLTLAVKDNSDPIIRFAIELFGIEEKRLLKLIDRYRIPKEYKEFAILDAKFLPILRNVKFDAPSILNLLQNTDAFRRRERFFQFLTTSEYLEKNLAEKNQVLKTILAKLLQIDNSKISAKGLVGAEFAEELAKVRLETIKNTLISVSFR